MQDSAWRSQPGRHRLQNPLQRRLLLLRPAPTVALSIRRNRIQRHRSITALPHPAITDRKWLHHLPGKLNWLYFGERMIELAENRYGKSRVRLMKVTRSRKGNELREWTVQVLLTGDFDTAHYEGDNSKILPTDTMKNTVYSVARKSSAISMEDFAKELVDFLLGR